MPAVEIPEMAPPPEEPKDEAPPIKSVVGIIYPPPEVRNIVDKTASFVARNGPEFESRIRLNEINNPKFNFLTATDPYHAYYQHKVKEFKEGKGQEPIAPKQTLPLSTFKVLPEPIKISQEPIVPKQAPTEFEFVADPPSISAFDLDVVKLTAQFVARNGRQFLTNLMNREQRNYQFDFLRPQHSLFNYFTKLVEQYTKILIPPKDLQSKLSKESDDIKIVLEQVKYRCVEWARFQERERRKAEEAVERERVAYAQIDWHGFVVVETVDFQPNEQGNLPPPTTPEEVGARVLAQERFEKGEPDEGEAMEVESEGEDDDDEPDEPVKSKKPPPVIKPVTPSDNIQVQDMEQDSSSSSEDEDERVHMKKKPPPPQPPAPPPPPPPSEIPQPPLPPAPDQVVIKKYNPKDRTVGTESGPDQFMVSPITGEKIPAHKVPEHMRIGLLDPKWIEERNRALRDKTEQEEVFAPGSAIETSLKQLAERRTDIFGVGIEETQIGKKIGEEEKKEKKVVWDGHTASMEKITQKARENISIEEQIAVIHKVKGLVPDEEKEKIGPSIPKSSSSNPPLPPMPKQMPQPPQPPHPPQSSMSSMSSMSGSMHIQMPPKPPPPMNKPPPPPPMGQQRMTLGPGPGVMVIQPPPRPPSMSVIGMPPQPMRMGPPQMQMRPPMRPPNYPMMDGPPRPPNQPPPPSEEEPPSKKQKTEDQLIPEEDFLRTHKGPVHFKVAIPKYGDKPEWNLNGQMLSFSLPLTDSVSVIKAKLNEALSMPAGKQKLQHDGIFIKDSNTLAYYNFMNGAVVSLQPKERGGRKK
ncbi:hypothetical protein ScPMuIL_018181 [Solemya velum]